MDFEEMNIDNTYCVADKSYFRTIDGVFKTIQLVLSLLVLILCLSSTFWSVEGAQPMKFVLVFCSITLTLSGIIYFCQLYCHNLRYWNQLEQSYGMVCGLMMLASTGLSTYMTTQFASFEQPPENFKALLISCAVLSLATSLSFYAYLCLIRRKGPISYQRIQARNRERRAARRRGSFQTVTGSLQPTAATSRGARDEQINLEAVSNFFKKRTQNPTTIDITVVQGSILSASCDAIVNSTEQFSLSGEVGRLLVAQGGQSIANDCANNPLYSSTNLRITNAGALSYKFIFHLNVFKVVNRLENALLELFNEANKRGVRSLAMPPVGTGGIGLEAQEVAKCIRKAINRFEQTRANVLQSISIYVFQQAMVATFKQEFPASRNGASNSVIPANWDSMGRQLWKRVALSPNSQEYKRVLALFNKTLQINVSKIERIQNPTLYNQFEAQQKKVTDVLAGRRPIITRELFHGTRADKCDSICNQGFDKGHSGINGTAYGKGVYFATTAKYSNTYAEGNLKHMFLANVITGEYCQGSSFMKVAPNQPNGSPYDSVVNYMTNPSMFVVFKDASVYPAYLVTYSTF